MSKAPLSTKRLAQKIIIAFLCTFLAFSTAACGRSQDGYKSSMSDPIEPFNRGVFAVNNVLDIYLIEPVAKMYNAIFPDFVRTSVQSFMRNLKSPLIVANSLLQGDIGNAGTATARFIINTTAGIGGLVDVASTQGFEYRPEDFGQTLAVWGFGDGFYIVLPVLGPSSLRDTGGLVGDSIADPVRIYAHNDDKMWIYYTRGAVEGLDTRARLVKSVADLRRNSLDYYAAVRSAYTQKRQSMIRNENTDNVSNSVPAYDEQN